MSLKHALKESIHSDAIHFNNSDDLIRYLEDNEFVFENKLDYYIKSGINGDVYKMKGTNKVIKIERYKQDLYTKIEKIKELQSKNIAHIYYLKKIGSYILSVIEFLKPAQNYMDTSSYFEFFIIYLGSVIQKRPLPFVPSYKRINIRLGKKYLMDYAPEEIIDELMGVFMTGDEMLLRSIMTVMVNSSWKFDTEEKTENAIRDIINNKKLIFDMYYGILDLLDIGIIHDDTHIDNILYDPKTNNFKLIDII